jgi:hypothetical protein
MQTGRSLPLRIENGENLIRPDQEIVPTWDDFKAGRDPVLDWVLKYQTHP